MRGLFSSFVLTVVLGSMAGLSFGMTVKMFEEGNPFVAAIFVVMTIMLAVMLVDVARNP